MLRRNVLRSQKDFDTVYRKGKSVPDRYVVVLYNKNRLPYSRTAFLASKKVGNSVQRNRARRLMKESVRTSDRIRFQKGYDYIIVARKSITDAKCRDVQKSLESAFRRIGAKKK